MSRRVMGFSLTNGMRFEAQRRYYGLCFGLQ